MFREAQSSLEEILNDNHISVLSPCYQGLQYTAPEYHHPHQIDRV